eukprot:2943614-Ditylum_brightwellii.AAC.1
MKPKEHYLDPADVISGYRPTSLTICKNDDLNERHIHLVTMIKCCRCHCNVANVGYVLNDDNDDVSLSS